MIMNWVNEPSCGGGRWGVFWGGWGAAAAWELNFYPVFLSFFWMKKKISSRCFQNGLMLSDGFLLLKAKGVTLFKCDCKVIGWVHPWPPPWILDWSKRLLYSDFSSVMSSFQSRKHLSLIVRCFKKQMSNSRPALCLTEIWRKKY